MISRASAASAWAVPERPGEREFNLRPLERRLARWNLHRSLEERQRRRDTTERKVGARDIPGQATELWTIR